MERAAPIYFGSRWLSGCRFDASTVLRVAIHRRRVGESCGSSCTRFQSSHSLLSQGRHTHDSSSFSFSGTKSCRHNGHSVRPVDSHFHKQLSQNT